MDFFQNNADIADAENVRPPPPPPNRGIDLAELYFAALDYADLLENNNINNRNARG
jgi:hypothetical protein